jgi:hypothetical protein
MSKKKVFRIGQDKITSRWTEFQLTFTGVNLDLGAYWDVQIKTLSKTSCCTRLLLCKNSTPSWDPLIFTLHTVDKDEDKIPCAISLRKQVCLKKFIL